MRNLTQRLNRLEEPKQQKSPTPFSQENEELKRSILGIDIL
jgi:hypothetical protein